MLLTAHIRDLATRYWELMHSPRTRRLECEVMAGRYQVVDPSCANTATVRYLRNRLCAALGLDRCVAHYWLDDLSQYRDVCHFMCAIQNYLNEKEKTMNEFPELKPMMLVECKNDRDIYTYYLIAGKHGEAYTAYQLNISSTGDVDLLGFYTVEDFPEQAVAVYATDREDPALSLGDIFRVAEKNNPTVCERRLIWKRESQPMEVTMEEVCEKFGCAVKIVKEK